MRGKTEETNEVFIMEKAGHTILTGLLWFILFGVIVFLFGKFMDMLSRLPERCPECKKRTIRQSSEVEEPGYGTRIVYTCSRCGFSKTSYVKHSSY